VKKKSLRVALVQMNSSADTAANLAWMKKKTYLAAKGGAQWVLFPEMGYQAAPKAAWRTEVAKYSSYLETFQSWARELGITLIPGSLREPAPRKHAYYNTLPVISRTGKVLAAYRKIHLFQATLPDRRYNEAAYTDRGTEVSVVDIEGVKLGLTICFDLRFPELFRALRGAGAQIITVPSAFVYHTGVAHWEVLLRARAIENQVFILAPNQTGVIGTGSRCFGNTVAISPWGKVFARKKDAAGILPVEIQLDEIATASQSLDAWGCRQPHVFQF
jgi:deaminated glutathione amidase